MSNLPILAPFDGWCSALDEVPDPVFAGRMLGDGLAIDPTSGILLAPCAGEIITLPASAHAVSIRPAEGIDVLIHIGVDTVHLGGRGFDACVRPGAIVRAGDELIRFDLDVAARGAKSLMTPIVVTPMEGVGLLRCRAAGPVSAGELLFEITGVAATAPGAAANAPPPRQAGWSDASDASRTLVVTLRQGLHARPAALLAQRAKSFGAQAKLSAHGRTANARSVVAIMALGVRQGDEVLIQASGTDAAQSVAGLAAGIEEALRMESAAGHDAHGRNARIRAGAPQGEPAAVKPPHTADVLTGVIAAPGFAVGRVVRFDRREITVAENGAGPARESAELDQARANVRTRLARVAAAAAHPVTRPGRAGRR